MLEPDLLDADENTQVVLCVDKVSGSAIGTARFQPSTGGTLLIEHSVSAPEYMRSETRAEISRLAAVAGADPLVRIASMKACYLLCLATQMRWMVICARKDSLVRQYQRLGFSDLLEDGRMVPMRHVGRIDHKVLALNIAASETSWRMNRHALADFFLNTTHPDIQLFTTKPALPVREQARVSTSRVLSAAMNSPRTQVPSRVNLERATLVN